MNEKEMKQSERESRIMGQFVVYMSKIDKEALSKATVKELAMGFFDKLEQDAVNEIHE